MPQRGEESTSRHASTGPGVPHLPEPGYAEQIRTLLEQIAVGTLSTLSRRHSGIPFGSLMPFALDGAGRPLLLISSMAMHTQNLNSDPRCSLFAAQATSDSEVLGAGRVTLMGHAEPVPEPDLDSVRRTYLARHPNSSSWVDSSDFSFFRLELQDLYYVGGFGVMGWVNAAEYAAASPDPLIASAPGIIQHMNADHVDSMILLARKHAGLEASEAVMTSVDRLGFQLRLRTPDGFRGARINFLREVRTPLDARSVLVEMVRDARRESGAGLGAGELRH